MMNKSNALIYVTFVILTVVCGSIIGYVTLPGAWYAALVKPSFNPPNWIFGPVWTTLYVMIGIAGARVAINDREGSLPKIWLTQIVLNFLWSPTFFTLGSIETALIVLSAMLIAILTFIVVAWKHDRFAALLFVPYAAWVAFAGVLNAAIWHLNPA